MRTLVPALVSFVAMMPGGHTPLALEQSLVSPYPEGRSAEILGLTQREVDDLREGRGMGLARAAELNGYPGPRHVLEAAEAGQLALRPAQVAAVREVFDGMSRETRRLGASLLEEERSLESAFRRGSVVEGEMRERVNRIAGLLGEIRTAHLRAHLATRALLSEAQVRRYQQIRGYAGSEMPPDRHRDRHHRPRTE
jgi:hypothetical protein